MDNIKSLINEELKQIDEYLCDIVTSDKAIFKDLSDFINGKSKRIRSVLSLLYLKANNVLINKNVIRLLAATEMIHTASLLHDDVVDCSKYRRGLRTLFEKYGTKTSVLCGDYILSLAVELLLKLNNSEVLNIFFNAVKKMSEAEIEQLLYRNSSVSVEKLLSIIEGKTSALFSACMGASALFTSLDVKTSSEIGKLFGILFQINNDFEPESIRNDRSNGVITLTDILGIEKTLVLKDNYKQELIKLLNEVPDNNYKKGIEGLIKLI